MRDRYILDLGDRPMPRTPLTARPGAILGFGVLIALLVATSNHFRPLGLICAALVLGAMGLISWLNLFALRKRNAVQGRIAEAQHARDSADQDAASNKS